MAKIAVQFSVEEVVRNDNIIKLRPHEPTDHFKSWVQIDRIEQVKYIYRKSIMKMQQQQIDPSCSAEKKYREKKGKDKDIVKIFDKTHASTCAPSSSSPPKKESFAVFKHVLVSLA